MNRAVDLFSGIGGFHFAAAQNGYEVAFASEWDAKAAEQYHAATGLVPVGDITQVDAASVPEHDLLLGGFPCQSFSIIGHRRGLDDERGQLIYSIFRILAAKRPSLFVLENVKQLATHDSGRTLSHILGELRSLGYATDYKVLNALRFGVPQRRERVFIVGFRDQEAASRLVWPEGSDAYRPLSEILEPEADLAPSLRVSARVRAQVRSKHSPSRRPSIWHQNKGGNISSHPYSCALRAGASYNYLLVNGERRLSGREMLRLQGFPESFPIIGSYAGIRKQCGNAVPVPMAAAVIEAVSNA